MALSVNQTISKNLPKLRKSGVLTVRPGYEIAGHQLTGKQAIVATVHTKKRPRDLAPKDKLPDKIGTYPVDVREATPHQRLRAVDPAAATLSQAYSRPEEREPEWKNEREMPSGKLLSSPKSDTQKAFARSKTTQPATHRALTAHQAKPTIPYAPPNTCPKLDPVEVKTTIIANASPDAGYATLSKFLTGTKQSLVIGMYDFTSGPLLEDFLSDLARPKTLQMVLDNPALNRTADQSDWQTVQALQSGLAQRAHIMRALVRSDVFAAAWIFPYAYHIKVIVRDGDTFWLSSGNLNNSNQPDLARPPHTEDRDWHVIVADKGLAKTFTAYLDYDYQVASGKQAPNPAAIEQAVEEARQKKAAHANPPALKPAPPLQNPVAARTFNNLSATITPLLTPDIENGQGQYLGNITKLIENAKESIFIQLQYIESSSSQPDGKNYNALLQAIAAKARTIDVRLIENQEFGEKWVEKMKDTGVDLTPYIRMQPNVHNKGFVIDHKTIVVSSQNFSPAGVEHNRDAGLIIAPTDPDPGFAKYFEDIFLADWNKAKPAAVGGAKGKTSKTAAKGKAPKRKPPAGGR